MPDLYYVPALILTVLLLPAFGYLFHRDRDTRSLLWLLGFVFSLISMLLRYPLGSRLAYADTYPWMDAAGQTALLAGTALFLASLSPLSFRVGRLRILYVIPYIVPLVIYDVLLYGVYRGFPPHWAQLVLFPALGVISLLTCIVWAAEKYSIPRWLSLLCSVVLGGSAFLVYFAEGTALALRFVESANLFMTALLVSFVFRRLSPGVVLSVLGFLAWSMNGSQVFHSIAQHPALEAHITQIYIMAKVVAAIGMILLMLEDEVAANKAAGEREHRVRLELEAYAALMLSRRRVEDFDQQAPEICGTVAAHSRFAQAALLLHSDGRYRLAGSAGLDVAIAKALDELAGRLPPTGFLADGSAPSAIDKGRTVVLDLSPWLGPGDDLKHLGVSRMLAVPMINRAVTEGALLLRNVRPVPGQKPGTDPEPLRMDDLLPIEMLTARLQATRSQTMMFERLMDSEKFGHLGQLAASVTQQLNNPLTVILGYASLLEGTSTLEPQDRKAIDSILTEARHMRSTMESLARVARPQADEMAAISIAELLTDLGDLHRPEFLERSIEFRLSLAPDLPRVLCSAQQLRQAVRHCLQFAMNAVQGPETSADEPRIIRLEAASEGSTVQILVAHSGSGFVSPERAFDPYMPPQTGRETSGLGLSLSLCATILRDNDGRASAVNLDPAGAAIILELNAA
jgi:signal transduction histidine kinase